MADEMLLAQCSSQRGRRSLEESKPESEDRHTQVTSAYRLPGHQSDGAMTNSRKLTPKIFLKCQARLTIALVLLAPPRLHGLWDWSAQGSLLRTRVSPTIWMSRIT